MKFCPFISLIWAASRSSHIQMAEGLRKEVPCGGQNKYHICPFLSSLPFSFGVFATQTNPHTASYHFCLHFRHKPASFTFCFVSQGDCSETLGKCNCASNFLVVKAKVFKQIWWLWATTLWETEREPATQKMLSLSKAVCLDRIWWREKKVCLFFPFLSLQMELSSYESKGWVAWIWARHRTGRLCCDCPR